MCGFRLYSLSALSQVVLLPHVLDWAHRVWIWDVACLWRWKQCLLKSYKNYINRTVKQKNNSFYSIMILLMDRWRCILVFDTWDVIRALISFLWECDSCSGFPALLYCDCENFVANAWCVTVLIHNLQLQNMVPEYAFFKIYDRVKTETQDISNASF